MNQGPSDSLIINKLDHLCKTVTDGFETNKEEHKDLVTTIKEMREEQVEARGHSHPHCETCITNETKINGLEKTIAIRDKIGVGAILVLIGAFIKSFWPFSN